MKNYLFICRHNFTRSKQGKKFLEKYLKKKKIKANVYSAGIALVSRVVGEKVNKKIIGKADVIFVMENYMKTYLIRNFDVKKNKIVVLGIKDLYGFLRQKSLEELNGVFEKIEWRRYL